jgi:hypothetical protein
VNVAMYVCVCVFICMCMLMCIYMCTSDRGESETDFSTTAPAHNTHTHDHEALEGSGLFQTITGCVIRDRFQVCIYIYMCVCVCVCVCECVCERESVCVCVLCMCLLINGYDTLHSTTLYYTGPSRGLFLAHEWFSRPRACQFEPVLGRGWCGTRAGGAWYVCVRERVCVCE